MILLWLFFCSKERTIILLMYLLQIYHRTYFDPGFHCFLNSETALKTTECVYCTGVHCRLSSPLLSKFY